MPAYKDKERGTWYCKFTYENWQGEKKSKLKRGFKTKKEALEWEKTYLQEQQASVDMEFVKFVEVYFADKAERLKERSVESKRGMIRTKIIPYFGKRKLNEIKPAEIMKWQNEMIALGYKPTYLRMIQNQMTAIFNHAERFYDLKNNPCKKIDKMGKSNAKELHFWTKDEYDVFINSFEEKEEIYRLIFQLLFWLGCRVGEVLALYKKDFDFQKQVLMISKTYYRKNKTDYITTPKTESSNREVAMPKFMVEELKEYLDRQYGLEDEDRIFPITERAVQKKMKQKAEKAGLQPIRVHDLRHSHVAFLIEKGTQPLVISQRVGHDSMMTTMNIYGHLYPNKQKQVANMLNAEATGEAQAEVVDIGTGYRKAGG